MERIRQAVVVAEGPASLERVAGLRTATRAVLTLHEGGAADVVVVCGSADVRQALALDPRLPGDRVRVRLADGGDVAAALRGLAGEQESPFLVARADRGFDAARVRALLEHGGRPGGQVARVAVRDGALLVAHDGDDAVRALALPCGDAEDLATAAGRRRAEDRLLRSLTKPTDGWVARTLNRRISRVVTRALLDTRVTPNQMTLVANVLGFLGVALVARGTWWNLLAGAALVQVQSILDGCDGELARLKYQGSRFGEWLDNVLDDTINIAYGIALGHAAAVLLDEPLYRWLGIATGAGYTIYNLVLYAHLALVHGRGNPFLFRWWFQKEDAYLQQSLAGADVGIGARVVAVLHAMGRRDLFLFAFLVFCALRVPQLAVLWYVAVAGVSAVLAIIHVAAGGLTSRVRTGQARSNSTSVR
jgi:phosphatidylglycerophosphate synthase